jgi:hypothetical protein
MRTSEILMGVGDRGRANTWAAVDGRGREEKRRTGGGRRERAELLAIIPALALVGAENSCKPSGFEDQLQLI